MQFEQVTKVRLVLDDQHLVIAAGRALRHVAATTLEQLVDRSGENPPVSTGRLPGAQQARLGPELDRAQRNAETVGRLPRRTHLEPGFRHVALRLQRMTGRMTASQARDCNAKLSVRRAGESR